MPSQPISTRPVNENEKLLREKFYRSIVAQSDLMDKLSERLIMLELAIPGLYATVLKLVRGDKVTVPISNMVYITFGCWSLAVILTLAALMPKKWTVDPAILKQMAISCPCW